MLNAKAFCRFIIVEFLFRIEQLIKFELVIVNIHNVNLVTKPSLIFWWKNQREVCGKGQGKKWRQKGKDYEYDVINILGKKCFFKAFYKNSILHG